MFNKIKLLFFNNRNFIRIIRYSLISLLLLIITRFFDIKNPDLKEALPRIFLLSSDVTSSFLSTLSGTFLTVTTFTFTTILTVLGRYADSFTPRIVQDFIDKPNVLSLFGVFIGGFFYTVLSLFMLQNIETDSNMLAGTIAIFYAVAAMLSFVLFVRRVLIDIKAENVIENIYQNGLKLVEEEAEKRKNSERFDQELFSQEIKIYANTTGFLYSIDSGALMEALEEPEGLQSEIVIGKRIGDYLPKGMYIAKLYLSGDISMENEEKEKFLSKLSQSLVINVKKNDLRDYHHEITNLVEIAMMALSPGINDPNTARAAIRKISHLLGILFSSNNSYVILDENQKTKIIYKGYTVKEELYSSFSQIIYYGKEDPLLSKTILEGIYLIYMIADQSVKEEIKDYLDYVYKICHKAMKTKIDKEQLEIIYKDFSKNRDHQSDEEVIREED